MTMGAKAELARMSVKPPLALWTMVTWAKSVEAPMTPMAAIATHERPRQKRVSFMLALKCVGGSRGLICIVAWRVNPAIGGGIRL